MRIAVAAWVIGALILVGCNGNGAAQGGANDNSAGARVKVNLPF